MQHHSHAIFFAAFRMQPRSRMLTTLLRVHHAAPREPVCTQQSESHNSTIKSGVEKMYNLRHCQPALCLKKGMGAAIFHVQSTTFDGASKRALDQFSRTGGATCTRERFVDRRAPRCTYYNSRRPCHLMLPLLPNARMKPHGEPQPLKI